MSTRFCPAIWFLASVAFLSPNTVSTRAAQTDEDGSSVVRRDPRLPPDDMPESVRGHWAPLGLPRLRTEVLPGDASPVSRQSFEVDSLESSADPAQAAGQKVNERHGVKLIELAPGKEWSRPLRSGVQETVFVSFQVYASAATIIKVGNVALGVSESPIPGSALLTVGEQTPNGYDWKPLGIHLRWETFGGRTMAAVQVLTLRLDPAAGVWDLYVGARQMLDNQPLQDDGAAESRNREVSVHAGENGAWVIGLVVSKENPLVEDRNANGIDDNFEKTRYSGSLLGTNASLAEQRELAKAWRQDQRGKPPQALFVEGPKPDRLEEPAGTGNK